MFFYRLFDCPKRNFGHCQILPHERGEEEHEKYIFPLKNVFFSKNKFLDHFGPDNDGFPQLWK